MLDILISPFARIIGVIVLIGALFGVGYYKGYSGEKQRFDTYKADIEAQVKAKHGFKTTEPHSRFLRRRPYRTRGLRKSCPELRRPKPQTVLPRSQSGSRPASTNR